VTETLEQLRRKAKAEFDRVDEAYRRKVNGLGCTEQRNHFVVCLNSVAGSSCWEVAKQLKVNPKGLWGGYQTGKCLVCDTYFISDYVGKYRKRITREQAKQLGYGVI
jgi:hypothetical protein